MRDSSGRFRRVDRLRHPREFARVRRAGRAHGTPEFTVAAVLPQRPTAGQPRRLGITVSRRVVGAVGRNRIKRRVREWFRRARDEIAPGTDVVVIARRGATRLSGRETAVLLTRLLRRTAGTAP